MTTAQRALLASVLSFSAAAWAVACGGDDDGGETAGPDSIRDETEAEANEPGRPAETSEESARVRQTLAQRRVHVDLVALAHLADVDRGGLYMDFGTPARMHYTMGRWHNGFLSDVSAGERDFTRMGTDARAWFHLDERGPIQLRFRGRAVGSDAVVVYLNGQRAGQIDFQGQGVGDYRVEIPAELVQAGENALMLRAASTRPVAGEDVAAEVDSIWIRPANTPADDGVAPPVYTELVRSFEVGGESRSSVVLRGDGNIRWYAEVPEHAELSFGVGASGETASGEVTVTVTPEGGAAARVFSSELQGPWNDQLIDLSQFAGEVVRIEFAVSGATGEVGIAGPSVVVPLPAEPLAEAQAPSVIVLLIDTLRASKLRPYNPQSRVRTPVLDAFAEQGAVFEHAQAPENWTKPSVASVLTSLTPMTHNTKEQSSSLPDSALMVSEVFQRNGFATASFIANGYVSDRFGFAQGWDHYTNYIREERSTEASNVFREAIAWIEEHQNDRFFTYIQTIDPHVPYDPPGEILSTYDAEEYSGPVSPRSTGNLLEDVKAGRTTINARDERRLRALHDAEITYHDQELGHFIDRLRELGLYDRVMFVVTSDHGEEFNEHGSFGHGHLIFQELLHVPLMMRWNGVIAPTRLPPTVSTMDIAPTILEAAGVPIPDEFEGHSLLTSARGQFRPGPSIAFSDKLDDRRVALAAGYKLITRGNLTWALFNLRTDPGEERQIDSGGRHPIALRYLRGLHGQFLGATDRGDWLRASSSTEQRVLPAAESQIDAELCRQLAELGYVDARCPAVL